MNSNSLVQQARSFFGAMPEEVVDNWLVERVESRGWPPIHPNWNALLRFYTPKQWSHFSWHKQEVDLTTLRFSPAAQNIIKELTAARFHGKTNGCSGIEDSRYRMERILDHIWETGRLPGTVILIKDREWEIVDGCHRISCYFYLRESMGRRSNVDCHQWAWVASPTHA